MQEVIALLVPWLEYKGCLVQLAYLRKTLEVHNENHSGDSCVCCSGAAGASKDI